MENEQQPQKALDRLEVLKKIEQYESEGKFDLDVENDPPSLPLLPNKVDYLQKKLSSKFMRWLAYIGAAKFMKSCINNKMLIIKEVKGIENWANIKGGAVITSNHFSPMDSFAMQYTYMQTGKPKKNRLYRVIREGNYTNSPGGLGMMMRHCDTLPLSSNRETMVKFMRAVDTLLKKDNFVLIYPEQAMWWNYRKPRPLKDGAYKIAVRNNVPVLPMFVTMQDSNIVGPDGFYIQEFTINVFPPIYPDSNKSKQQNIKEMMDKNARVWRECYESTYGKKLTYNIKTKKPANK